MRKNVISIILVIFLSTTIVHANNINDLTKEQNTIKKEIENKNNEINNINKEINDKENDKQNLQLEIINLDKQLSKLEDDIYLVQIEIQNINKEIEIIKDEIDKLNKEAYEKQEELKQVIKLGYENQTSGYLVLLLESKGIANFLKRLDILSSLVKRNRDIVKEIKDLQVKLSLNKDKLDAESITLEQKKDELNLKKNELNDILNDKNSKIIAIDEMTEQLKVSRSDIQDSIAQREREQEEIQERIRKAIEEERLRQEEEERLRQEAQNQSNHTTTTPQYPSNNQASSSGYLWPSPVSRVITSYFGDRVDPVLGYSKHHNGMDIAASMGTPILASASGTVLVAGYSSSYGYYVVISHGGGITTLNAHASKLLVSVGQRVERGQQIAKVGSSGWSTGPHIHIEFTLNGVRKDPLDYLE